MKILVTGGAGYIGSHVNRLLSNAGHDTVILDDLSTGRRDLVVAGRLVIGDLGDQTLLDNLFQREKFEAVFHFAGSIIVPESVSDPIKYYKNNTKNALGLINTCHRFKIEKFIFSSTAAVYGIPKSNENCDEASVLNPISPYGRSKLMTEWMMEDLGLAFPSFKYVTLRYFNVAGASLDAKIGQCSPSSTHLIKIACETALGKRSDMKIFGDDYNTPDGTCLRDYIHVEDLAQAHLDALSYLNRGCQSVVLNCGYGHGTSVKQVVDMIKKVSGANFPVAIAPRRDGDVPTLIANADKIRRVLNWNPKYDNLEIMIKTALAWERKLL